MESWTNPGMLCGYAVCGKKGANRMQSCYDHAVPVYADTVHCDASGVYATRAPEPKEQVIDPAWVYRPG